MQRVASIDIGMSATLALLKRRETLRSGPLALVYAPRRMHTHVPHIRYLVGPFHVRGERGRDAKKYTWAGVEAGVRARE